MKKWVRRIRAAIGIGLTWAVGWFGAGLVLLMIVGPGAADVPFPLGFGLLGFLAGTTFAGVLAVVERRRGFDQLSLPRFAGWGAVGGLLLSLMFASVVALAGDTTLLGDLMFLGPLFAVAGAASAAGSLALARMAGDGARLDAAASSEVRTLPGTSD